MGKGDGKEIVCRGENHLRQMWDGRCQCIVQSIIRAYDIMCTLVERGSALDERDIKFHDKAVRIRTNQRLFPILLYSFKYTKISS